MDKGKKVEEPKYSDSEQQGRDGKTHNFRNSSTRAKIKTKKRGKKTIQIQNWLKRRIQVLAIEMHVHYAINLLKQE